MTGTSYSGLASPDTSTDACRVYTDADVAHAVKRYGLLRHQIVTVGNPDLIKFGLESTDLASCAFGMRNGSAEVVYVDTALLEAAAAYSDEDDFVLHLVETRDALASAGLKLIVKLHPAHSRTAVPKLLAGAGVLLCPDDTFLDTLRSSCAAIVEPSSAALVPALLG